MTTPLTLQDYCHRAFAQNGAQPALEFQGRWYDWAWLKNIAARTEASLNTAGVPARAPVGFVPRNHPASAAAFLGLLAAGRGIRMIYVFQSPEGIARDAARLNLAALVAHAEDFTQPVQDAACTKGLALVALEGDGAYLRPGFERATAAPDPDAPQMPMLEILTSGTTGPPKHFPLSYGQVARFMLSPAVNADPTAAAQEPPPALIYFPFGNISGLYNLLPPLLNFRSGVLLERFEIRAWHDYVLRYRPLQAGLPTAGVRMALDADLPVEDLASLRFISTGAAPLDPNTQRGFEARYGIPILLSYGATEFGGPVCAMTADLHPAWGAQKFGSVGRALPGAQLRIVDPDTGDEMPPGREGVLEVIAARIGPGWMRTTDMAMIDADGFMFHRGRADGAIQRGGFKLLPEVIGRALALHPSIAAAAVVGITDARLGQLPAAAIQLAPGAAPPTPEELDRFLRQHVYATHIPKEYRFVPALPRTPSLKVDLRAVKALFQPPADG